MVVTGDHVCVCYSYWVDDDKVAIIGPRSKFHAAVLQVEGEVKDDDLTVALKDCGGSPCYHTRVLQQDLRLMDDGKVSISAAHTQIKKYIRPGICTF